MDLVEAPLAGLGFACRRMRFGEIENLYARRGTSGPTSASPATPTWCRRATRRPGRRRPSRPRSRTGCCSAAARSDMKSAIAAWIAAVVAVLARAPRLAVAPDHRRRGRPRPWTAPSWWSRPCPPRARSSTTASWASRPRPRLGDMVKVGRRGSINAWITVRASGPRRLSPPGGQPAPVLIRLLAGLDGHGWTRAIRVPAVEPGGHHHRRRQHGHQRHPGRGAGAAEHPLQPDPHRRVAVGLDRERAEAAKATAAAASGWSSAARARPS